MSEFADLSARLDVVQHEALKPPPKLSLSEWADEHFYLSAESAAEPGRWKTLPYQRAIMDAFTDPRVTQVSVMKSARVGWTKIVNALIGYSIHQDPAPILVVQPTVDDAKGYSKEEIAPMLRDCPALAKITFEEAEEVGPRDSGNTILHKKFPGGVLSMVGANSGAGFRRVSRKRVLFDEVDGYPPSAGSDGDQIKLGTKRTDYYWDRKIGAGSTPLVDQTSRIKRLFEAGDQRRNHVPCPQCGHMDFLVFRPREDGRGHVMKWPKGKPKEAYFACSKNGCVIEHKDKRSMIERGRWIPDAPFDGHASFHIWAAYSYSPNATWGQLAEEFIEAEAGGVETLKTFVNTVLGETWVEKGEAPEWERLYNRREPYPIGSVPEGVLFLTAGVDVQKDRFVYEVVGWCAGKESHSIDAGVIPADTANLEEWARLDELLDRTYDGLAIRKLAVDSGFNTQMAYSWCRGHPMSRVIAVKGVESARTLLGSPSPVDVKESGKRLARGYKVWPVSTSTAKSELYGWLRLKREPEAVDFPPGWCHFPEYGADYFKQLTAEHLVSVKTKQGYTVLEWQLISGRENHWLDCRVYARAAASALGLDRMRAPKKPAAPKPPPEQVPDAEEDVAPVARAQPPKPAPPKPEPKPRQISDSKFFGRRGTGWLKKR